MPAYKLFSVIFVLFPIFTAQAQATSLPTSRNIVAAESVSNQFTSSLKSIKQLHKTLKEINYAIEEEYYYGSGCMYYGTASPIPTREYISLLANTANKQCLNFIDEIADLPDFCSNDNEFHNDVLSAKRGSLSLWQANSALQKLCLFTNNYEYIDRESALMRKQIKGIKHSLKHCRKLVNNNIKEASRLSTNSDNILSYNN